MGATRNAKRILVVEDAPIIRQILARSLQEGGHEIETAVDGIDGLRKFRSKPWDLVITDFQMPGMDGEEMTAAIKAEAPDVPVIMVTGSTQVVTDPGVFYAFIAKPFRGNDLLKFVSDCPYRAAA